MSCGLLNNSLPGFSIHSHLTPILNFHFSHMLSYTRHRLAFIFIYIYIYIYHTSLLFSAQRVALLPSPSMGSRYKDPRKSSFHLSETCLAHKRWIRKLTSSPDHVSNVAANAHQLFPRTSIWLTLKPYGVRYPTYKCYLLPKNIMINKRVKFTC